MKKTDEIKKWIKDHESEVKTAAKITAGIVITIVIGKKIKKSFATMDYTPKTKTITYNPKAKTAEIERCLPKELVDMGFDVFSDGDRYIEFADYGDSIPELAIEEMHKAVDAIKEIPGFNPDKTRIQAMFNVYDLD